MPQNVYAEKGTDVLGSLLHFGSALREERQGLKSYPQKRGWAEGLEMTKGIRMPHTTISISLNISPWVDVYDSGHA